jgi:pimeloyl-ACP methyl ester carboxylesterase
MKKLVIFVLLVLLVSLLGCANGESAAKSSYKAAESAADTSEEAAAEPAAVESKYTTPDKTSGTAQRINLKADDGVNLVASYYPGRENAVILLHMMNKDRHDWDSFAKRLNLMGYTVISFDLRGHGDSDLNWMDFKDVDYKPMVSDVGVAAQYLYENNDVKIERVYTIGASIGANLAVMYGATDSKVKKAVMLSPGANYHGLNPIDSIEAFNKPILFVYSKLDDRSARDCRNFVEMGKGERQEIAYADSYAHGNDMFKEHSDLEQKMIDFIKN